MAIIDEFKGLRGLCTWWVVLGHVALAAGISVPAIFDPRHAVDVFILLSGFVIFLTLDRQRDSWGTFVLRRGFRLFPVYLTALLVSTLALGWQAAAILGSPFAESEWAVWQTNNVAAAQEHFWPNLLAHVPLLQGVAPPVLIPQAEFAFLAPAWWVSLEWQFYLLAPILYRAVVGRRWVVLALIGAATVALAGRSGSAFLPDHLWLFGVGIASYYFLTRERLTWLMPAVLAVLAIVTGALLMPALAIWFGVLAVLTQTLPGGHLARRLLALPALRVLGRMSYSTYVLHMLAILAAMLALNAFQLEAGQYRALFIPLAVGLTLLLSYAGYRWIEIPGRRLGARVAARRPLAAAPQRRMSRSA